MAINAEVRAFLSTYLDIGLGNIGRLKRLACDQPWVSKEKSWNLPVR
jgi:hypothetical protein